MDIFESLENLNVSEECFDDIIDMVEELLNEEDSLDDGSHIRKKYGKPEYKGTDKKGFAKPFNKSAELYAKSHPEHRDLPSYEFTDGKGVGEHGKRTKEGESDRRAWAKVDTPKEIQEPLSVAKSQEKGARKLLSKDDFKDVRDKVKAKRLLQGALRDKSAQLRKKADHLDKESKFDTNDRDNFEDNVEIAHSLQAQADQRKEAAQKAAKEAKQLFKPKTDKQEVKK